MYKLFDQEICLPEVKMLKLIVLLVVGSLAFQALGQTVYAPVGYIRGRSIVHKGVKIFQFLGIPYGQCPIGDLILEKPLPSTPWKSPVEKILYFATGYAASCPQRTPWYRNDNVPNLETQFDCLRLNVYVPGTLKPKSPKSVMVHIHGGSYFYQQGMRYDGTVLAGIGDIIVVTINYRLDVFGFMSTKDNAITGNFGLWDQRQALIWVKENIHAFGGDNSSITLFGESAGSYSIGMHMLSPHNKGLFQRVISQSGVALSPIGLAYDPLTFARVVSDTLGCTVIYQNKAWDTHALKLCFREKNESEILSASRKASDFGKLAYRRIIGPVVDGDFLKDSPIKSLKRDDVPFKYVDLMIGTNSAEGGLALWPLIPFQKSFNFKLVNGIPRRVFRDHIATAITRDYYNNSLEVLEKLINAYSSANISDLEQARKVVDMYGDFILQAPTVQTLQYHSNLAANKATYQYYFTHVPESRTLFPWFQGANHADELAFVFGPEVMYPQVTDVSEAEIEFSHQVMKYWTNFAKYGNPNGKSGNKWKRYNKCNPFYMELGLKQTGQTDLLSKRVNLWLHVLGPTDSSGMPTLYVLDVKLPLIICLLMSLFYLGW